MKKRVIALLLCMTMALMVTACGSSDGDSAVNTEESTEAKMPVTDLAKYEFNYADYVTLCDYRRRR